MGDRSGTETGLVGEHAAANALGNGETHGDAHRSTGNSLRIECADKDGLEHAGDRSGIDDDHAPDMEPTLQAVIEALKLLIQRDREAQA